MNELLALNAVNYDLSTPNKRREAILTIEQMLFEHPDAVFGNSEMCPLTHLFSKGCYVRTIKIPAGTYIVGKIHLHEHPNMLLKGDVSMITEEGLVRFQAPQVLISPAGCKRAIYTHTDTMWTTIHLTDKTNVEEIEKDIAVSSYEEYNQRLLEETPGRVL